MQLMLILGVVFAIGAVAFALQNNVLVAVTFAVWPFEGSLALVLLLALGLGVLITGLLSSPAAIRGQWSAARLRRQVVDLEREVAEQRTRNSELVADLARLSPAVVTAEREEQKPYVGLRSLLAGESEASAADVRPSAVEKGR